MGDEPLNVGPGTRLGRYEVAAAIGAGGMGAVFMGRDTVLDRAVAIKVLPDAMRRDERARARFEREAKLLAALSHPNILGIHDFGEADGIAFAVMELLEGATLRQRLRNGPLDADDALPVALAIARGLAAAHARGIVHRDLKPENVFLPSDGPVKILDFGLARLVAPAALRSDEAETMFATAPGVMFGTLPYMAPEQVRGGEGDARADVFAFGAVLHEMLTGRPAFAAGAPADTICAVLTLDAPPLPPAVGFAQEIVATCLAKDASVRYASAQPLVAALEALRPARERWAAEKPGAPASAHATPDRETASHQSIAVLPFADMSRDRSLDYLCEGIAEEILLALARVEGLRVVARSSAFRFKGAGEDVREVGRALSVETVLEGSLRAAGDRLRVVTQLVDAHDGYQLWSERFDRRLDDAFAIQDEIAAAVASTLRVRLRGASGIRPAAPAPRDAESYALYLKARRHWNQRTEASLRRSIEVFGDCLARDPGYAHAHAGLAEAWAALGFYGAAPPDEAMPAARAAAERALALSPLTAGALAALGCVAAMYDRQWAAAEQHFRRAITVDPGTPSARTWFAMHCLIPLGRFDEAGAELRQALAVDPLSAPVSTAIGVASYFAGRYEEAVRQFFSVLELEPQFPLARQFLALALGELNRHDEARAEAEATVDLTKGAPEPLAAAGYLLARAGDAAGARARLEALAALSRTRYVSAGMIAQIHAGLGETDETFSWLERANGARAADLVWLGVRPVFSRLRADGRFRALLARIGLPQG
jgi:serine/threonine-protein kinase